MRNVSTEFVSETGLTTGSEYCPICGRMKHPDQMTHGSVLNILWNSAVTVYLLLVAVIMMIGLTALLILLTFL